VKFGEQILETKPGLRPAGAMWASASSSQTAGGLLLAERYGKSKANNIAGSPAVRFLIVFSQSTYIVISSPLLIHGHMSLSESFFLFLCLS
jgi:hypothetical protein